MTDELLFDLVSLAQACGDSHKRVYSFSSPAYLAYYGRPVSVRDIPIQSFDVEKAHRGDPAGLPWDESIKNLVSDLCTVSGGKRYMSCVVLAMQGYKYARSCLSLMHTRYCIKGGMCVVILPHDAMVGMYSVLVYSGEMRAVEVEVENVSAVVAPLCVSGSTLVMCHDVNSERYRDILELDLHCASSVQCTPTMYVKPVDGACSYVASVYSCPGSLETRAVSTGPLIIGLHSPPAGFSGKLNFFGRCIRGSTHRSGRCYDCEVLYNVVRSVYQEPPPDAGEEMVIELADEFKPSLE